MELNEASATRVNDVYSKLAAITAADTNQIATAMSKTASIASSANMEFETTAALLAQIIETTQEAPETAGTAMKTIIARFTEVKQLFSQGQLTGEDEEGEAININKIDEALKTVGISLKDFLNGSRGLDDILLELASKWDSLDLATQRYIATTAAGSRQQSRFIAMMSDYGRTAELVNAASNSAGAGQEQFGETLESLESKLNALKNAWDNFLMGITNNEVVKGFVDVITTLLETVNKVTNALSGSSGGIKMFINLFTSFMAIKGAKGILKAFGLNFQGIGDLFKVDTIFKGAKGTWRQKGLELGKNFLDGLKNSYSMKNPFSDFFKNVDYILFSDSSLGTKDAINLTKSFQQELNLVKTPEQFNELSKKYSQLGLNVKLSKEEQEKYNKLLESSKGSFDKVAAGAGIAGAALLGLSEIMEITGASEKTVETIRALGVAFMALPVVTNIAKAAIKTFAKESSAAILSTPIIGWIAGIITALITLGGVLAAVIDTPAEKMEKLTAAAEKASERVEDLKSELSDFNSKMEELKTSETELDGLIVGTQAWKEALEGVNDQILSIIQEMPELAQYVQFSENGQLSLNEQEMEVYQQGLENKIKTANRNAFATNAALNYQKEQIKFEELYMKGAISILSSSFENEHPLMEALDLESFDGQVIFDALREMDSYEFAQAEAMVEAAGASEGYLNALHSAYNDIQQQAIQTNNAVRAMLLANEEIANYKYGNEFIDSTSGGIYREYSQELGRKTKNQLISEYELLNPNIDISGARNKGLKEILLAEGYSQKAIDEMDNEQIEQAVEGILLDTKVTGVIENLIDSIEGLAEVQQKAIVAAATENWDNLSLGDIDALGDTTLTEILDPNGKEGGWSDAFQDFVEQQGLNITDDNIEEQVNAIFEEIKAGIQGSYDEILTEFIQQTGDRNALTQFDQTQYAIEEYQALANALAQVGSIIEESGRNLPEEFSSVMQEILTYAGEDADKVLGALSGFDFSNPEDVKKFGQYLRDLEWPISKANEFQDALHEIIGEFNAFNPETAKDDIKNALDFADDIADREENALSQEEYEKAIDAGINASNFVWNGQEWVYLGGTMADLATAVRENTAAMTGETRGQLENKVAAGEWLSGVFNNIDARRVEDALAEQAGAEGFFRILDDERVTEVMGQNGQMVSVRELNNAQREALYQFLIDSYNNLTGNQGQLEAMTTYQYSNAQSSQEMLGMGATNQTQIEARTRALQAAAYQEGLTDEMIEIMADSLRDQGVQIDENSDLWLAHVRDSKKARRELHELSNSLVNNYEALKDINSEGYSEALLDTVTKAQAVFGDQVDTAFVTEYIDLFLALAEGGDAAVSAWEQLQGLSFDKKIEKVGTDTINELNIQLSTVNDWIKYLDGLEFDIYGNADLSNLVEGISFTEQQMLELEGIIESLGGYELTWSREIAGISPSAIMAQMATINGQNVSDLGLTGDKYLYDYKLNLNKTGGAETFRPNSAGGGGGGGGSEEWENPYDKLYNTLEKINEELRTRERIERRYQNLIRYNEAYAQNLLKYSHAEIQSLEEQRKLQNEIKQGRLSQLEELIANNADLNVYAWAEEGEDKEQLIQIDWDKINSVTDSELGQRIEDYVSKLEEWRDRINEVNDSLADIEDQIVEINERGKDEYLDLEGRIKDAIVSARQREIDELTAINESINDANSKLLNGIQKAIDKSRQERDNAKTEEDLANKQRRLAYLQQDTSGANRQEILELEKEISEGQQDYTDTLIDQKISELQEQNDKAAEQREIQIKILEAQLDYAQQTGMIWEEVDELLKSGTSLTENLVKGSELESLLKREETWQGMSRTQKNEWVNELNNLIAQSLQYLMNDRQLEKLGTKGSISFTTADGKKLSGTVDANGNVKVDGQTYSQIYQGLDGNYYTTEKYKPKAAVTPASTTTTATTSARSYPYGKASETKGIINGSGWGYTKEDVKAIQYALNELGYGNSGTKGLDGEYGPGTRSAIMAFQKAMGIAVDGDVGDETRAAFKLKQFKTGGLADFTGPAWLDGTKSKPELILSAKDTENFITLKNVLESFMTSFHGKSTPTTRGDSNFDIDINVESIGSDYDVDQLADKIKDLINEDARYRNNNVISLTR